MGHGFRFTSFRSRNGASAERAALAAEAMVADITDDAVVVIAARSFRLGRSRSSGCFDDAGCRSGELRDGQVAPVEERLTLDPVPAVASLRFAGLPEPDAHRIACAVPSGRVAALQPFLQARRDVDVRFTELVVLDCVSGCLFRHSHHLLEVDVRATGGGSTIYYTTLRVICKLNLAKKNPRLTGGADYTVFAFFCFLSSFRLFCPFAI